MSSTVGQSIYFFDSDSNPNRPHKTTAIDIHPSPLRISRGLFTCPKSEAHSHTLASDRGLSPQQISARREHVTEIRRLDAAAAVEGIR